MNFKIKTLFLSSIATLFLGAVGVPPIARQAESIIGRPLTPLSFAGVARRTAYRSMAYGGAYGGYGYGYGAYRPYVAPVPVVPVPVAPGYVAPYW